MEHLFTSTITELKQVTSRTVHGTEVFTATSCSIPCRVVTSRRLIKDVEGEEVRADALMFVIEGQSIALNTNLWVGSVEHSVIGVDAAEGMSEVHHYEFDLIRI